MNKSDTLIGAAETTGRPFKCGEEAADHLVIEGISENRLWNGTMSETAAALMEVNQYLDGLYNWVLKSRSGLTREDAKKIFHRYRTPGADAPTPEPTNDPEAPKEQSALLESQSRKIDQIIGYMEETTQRLDQIENDIGYLKDRIEVILKKL